LISDATYKLASGIAVDVSGIVGTMLVAIPVLKDFSFRAILSRLLPNESREFARAAELAKEQTEVAMVTFRRSDLLYFRWGLAAISASYMLNMVTGLILGF
jgi:hypothetical protein